MEQYLIDTNVVSDYFAAALPASGEVFLDCVIDAVPNLSIITQIELLCWKTTRTISAYVQCFVDDSNVFSITPDVVAYCVQIRKHKKVKTPDAIIAATALVHGLAVITRNVKDFEAIPELDVIDPHTL